MNECNGKTLLFIITFLAIYPCLVRSFKAFLLMNAVTLGVEDANCTHLLNDVGSDADINASMEVEVWSKCLS